MKRCRILGLSAITVSILALAAGTAVAQSAKDLVGAWTLVSAGDAFGPNPEGLLMFDANGRVAAELFRSNLPKYASGVRTKGTPEEYKATVEGSISFFGTYSVSGTDLLLHIESCSFPNWNGADQKRTNLTVVGDELKWTQPTPSMGGPPIAVVWKRAK
jgi:hypothetical protein